MQDVEDKIVKQVEYYFGDINLPKDRFLQEEMRMNGDGWVRLSELMKFNRLKRLCDDDSRVMNILSTKCELLEVDAKDRRVRRKLERALPRDKMAFARDLLPRSVYVKGFSKNVKLDDIQAYFVRVGVEPEAIRMRRRRDGAKGGPKSTKSDDEEDEEEETAAAGGDQKADESKEKYPFKGSVFAIFRSVADGEQFLKAVQASSDAEKDAAVFDASVPFEKKWKSEYFREKKQSNKDKRRAAQSAYENTKKSKFGEAKPGNGAQAAGERPFDHGMLLRLNDVPQALLDFNELKKLFSAAEVEIFADLMPATNAAIVRIKRAPAGLQLPSSEDGSNTVAAKIWHDLCAHFGPKQAAGDAAEAAKTDAAAGDKKLPVLTYKDNKLNAEVIFGEEETRFWKDLFAKWEAGASSKPQRGSRNKHGKQQGKRGKRKWNDKGKNGRKNRDDDDGAYGSDNEGQSKRAKASEDD